MRVIKRRDYYYLQHSFRKNKKVVTREKYLGKAVPSNLEEIKKSFLGECNKISLFVSLDGIKKEFSAEWAKYPESIKEKTKVEIAIAFTYNTSAIEGSTITLEETKDLIEGGIAPNKPIHDIEETRGHVKVFLEMLKKRGRLSVPIILRWHKDLFGETKTDIAGKFRNYLVRVGPYTAPHWKHVRRMMRELMLFYNSNKTKMHPVELAARVHYKLEKIHPFGDGNGRVGRLIMNGILWQNGYPMLIIEFKKRKFYYRALRKGEDAFFHYFARYYIRAHKRSK